MIGGLPPDAAVRLLEQRAAVLRSQLRGGAEMQRYAADLGVPRLFLIEADYRRSQIQAEIEFTEYAARSPSRTAASRASTTGASPDRQYARRRGGDALPAAEREGTERPAGCANTPPDRNPRDPSPE